MGIQKGVAGKRLAEEWVENNRVRWLRGGYFLSPLRDFQAA